MKIWIGVVAAVGALFLPVPGWADTILFRSGGILNGQAVDSAGTIVDVDPGEQITGTLEISVHNAYPSGHVVPVGGTVTWGDRQSQLWQIDSWVGTGWTDFSVGISETAPTTPGLYHIVFALSNECRYFHVMSATNWAVAGSPTVCGSLESPPIWFDGNDIGWDWTSAQFQQSENYGQVTQMWWYPRDNEFRENTVGANWVGIRVLASHPTALGDFVWEDLNADGIQDGELDQGIAGVGVELFTCDANDNLISTGATTTTDSNGLYLFENLVAGRYAVKFSQPAGFLPSPRDVDDGNADPDARDSDADLLTGETACVDLGAEDTNLALDAGYYRPATIGDLVWNDLDGDGVQEAGEPGVPGTTVELLDCDANDVLDSNGGPVGPVTTDANGLYNFVDLLPGQYRVRFTNNDSSLELTTAGPQGVKDPNDSDAVNISADGTMGTTECITLDSGEDDETWDAGLLPVAGSSLGDLAWEDLNADGIQDGELDQGIAGVGVELFTCDANDNLISTGATTTTDSNGLYLFENLVADRYAVKFSQPAGFLPSPRDVDDGNADPDARDSDADLLTGETACVDLGVEETNLALDAGYYRPATIGDLVWNDLDGDGVQEAGEPGVPGTTVELLDCDANEVLDSNGDPVGPVTTDANGLYNFVELLPGQYRVRFTNNDSSLELTTAGPQGVKDPNDSDAVNISADGTMGTTECITLDSGEDDETWDAGLVVHATANEPPDCSNAEPSVDLLWPPNHNFAPIDIKGVTDPDGDVITITTDSIFQDEAVDAKGSGHTAPDGRGVGTPTAELRAERSGKGNGRVYHIGFTADDGNSESCSGEVTVGVPHDRGKGSVPVDGGALYDSTVVP